MRVVFFGLFTPLQGAPVIGRALARLATTTAAPAIQVTMIGTGQDLAQTRELAGEAAAGSSTDWIEWIDWVEAADLPAVVARHDVCLGIFGTGPKALRVVPNKVFQGAAAGCAIVTSDTDPQARVLGVAAILVPPGDDAALADVLLGLAADPSRLSAARAAAHRLAAASFTPAAVTAPLHERLLAVVPRRTP